MTEELLHHIWEFRLFDNNNLITTSGQLIEIIKPGDHNTDSGPDFFNARMKIGKTTWAGNVEVHVRASDWDKHLHQYDKAYDNIVLHVVYAADKKILRKNGEAIPVLELKSRINERIYSQYVDFKSAKGWIPCEKQLQEVSSMTLNSWLDRLLVERLEKKSVSVIQSLKLNKNNWEETFYQHLARSFGSKVNAEAFELLAKSVSINTLSKQKNSLFRVEALLFGQAGMLDKRFTDDYPTRLKKEYEFLKQKFGLIPIDSHLFKFLRLRPVNFPTVRIAQLAALIQRSDRLFSRIMEAADTEAIRKLLSAGGSDYWNEHYRFDKRSPGRRKLLGANSIDVIIINTVVPFLFVYGRQKNEENYVDKALSFLEQIAGEKNAVIEKWSKLKAPVKSAYSTQALLQLKNEYCNKKRCLQCGIGSKLLASAWNLVIVFLNHFLSAYNT